MTTRYDMPQEALPSSASTGLKASSRVFAILALLMLAALAVVITMLNRSEPPVIYPSDFQVATVAYVIDGDTVDVNVDGDVQRIRLIGIDAPESASYQEDLNTPEGQQAADFTTELMPIGSTVYLQKDQTETDKYGRLLRYVWIELPDDALDEDEVKTKMANAIIIEAGYAEATRFRPDTTYADLFEAAQKRAAEAEAGVSYYWSKQ